MIDSSGAGPETTVAVDQRSAEPGFARPGRWRRSPGLPEVMGDTQGLERAWLVGALLW